MESQPAAASKTYCDLIFWQAYSMPLEDFCVIEGEDVRYEGYFYCLQLNLS